MLVSTEEGLERYLGKFKGPLEENNELLKERNRLLRGAAGGNRK